MLAEVQLNKRLRCLMVGRGIARCLLFVDRDHIAQHNKLVVPLSTATSWSPATVLKTYIPSTAPCLQHLISLKT